MDQKLQDLFRSVSPRAAWITIGSCTGFWLLCLTGVLTPPLSASASITLFWFYAVLMLVLASGLAAIGAAAALVVRRRDRRAVPPDATAAEPQPERGARDAEDPAESADLGQILNKPACDDR